MQVKIFLAILLFITALIISNAQNSLEYIDKFNTEKYIDKDMYSFLGSVNKHLTASNNKIYYSITVNRYKSNIFFHDILEYLSPYCELLNFHEIIIGYYSNQKYVFKCKKM